MYIFETTLDIDTVPFRLCDTLKALYDMFNRALVCLVALAASVNVFNHGTVAPHGVQAQYLLGLGECLWHELTERDLWAVFCRNR